MKELKSLQKKVEAVFNRILQDQMVGIPILNPMIRVQTLGFQIYEGRTMGIVITPWLMNLILFPNQNDHWEDMKIGQKQDHLFPSNRHEFMVNELEGIGIFQTLSLFSPMHEFENQDHAIAAANAFLEILLKPVDESERLDEKRLEQFLDGQEMDDIYQKECKLKSANEQADMSVITEHKLSRRDILRGNFSSQNESHA